MSTKLTGYVWDGCAASGMKLSSVAIMARQADFSNDEGVCWPSIETIARQIGAGMSTVRTAIARLEAEGWLTRKARRQGNRNASNVYQLNVAKLQAAAFSQLSDSDPSKSDASKSDPSKFDASKSGKKAGFHPSESGGDPSVKSKHDPSDKKTSRPDASQPDTQTAEQEFLTRHPDAVVFSPKKRQWGTQDDLTCAQWLWKKIIALYEQAAECDGEVVRPKEPNWTAWANEIRLTEMNDTSGRWSYARQLYGHVYTAKTGTLSELVTAGDQFNQQHITLAGYEKETQTPADELAASRTARAAVFIRNDPARPTQTGELVGMLPAPKGKRFTMTEQQTLLSHGVATAYVESGVLRIQRDVTTYRKNAYGVADNSYLDSETLHTSAYVLRKLKSVITSKYGRHKLASDGTRFGPGQAIVTPAVIKGELLATYRQLERAGIVENYELFKQYLVVERDASDPNRLNTLFPPDYVNQLRVFAVVNQFRLQYSEESA